MSIVVPIVAKYQKIHNRKLQVTIVVPSLLSSTPQAAEVLKLMVSPITTTKKAKMRSMWNDKIIVQILSIAFAYLFRSITFGDDNHLSERTVVSNCFVSLEKRDVRQKLLEQVWQEFQWFLMEKTSNP